MGTTGQNTESAQAVPLIDPSRCAGCGLCVKVCPTGSLKMQGLLATVARPWACDYNGYCERVCPYQAISRPFRITLVPEIRRTST